MEKENIENNVNDHIFSSAEVIEKVLNTIGLTREKLSTYQQYQCLNGDYVRIRVSNHGIFLQHWYDKNREARINGQDVPKLDVGQNLAITFAPNEEECVAMGKPFPMKIKNVTTTKTQQGNNVKPQFKVRHICYYSWRLTQEDVDSISASLSNCVTNGGSYNNPLEGNTDKVVEWEDISNLPPKKVDGKTLKQNKDNKQKLDCNINMNKKLIRLTESDLKRIIKESVNKVFNENENSMTREEEINIAAWENTVSDDYYQKLFYAELFANGAVWADNNPRKGLVDIENVVEWLKSHINDYLVRGRDIDLMFDDLIKAMEV